jgi:DNA-binding NarL/FixJ family response regulator
MFAVADVNCVVPQSIVQRLCEQLHHKVNSDKHQASLEGVHLTHREKEIVRRIAGKRNKESASELDLSRHTVKAHVHTILQKLKCRHRSELVALSIKRGWI